MKKMIFLASILFVAMAVPVHAQNADGSRGQRGNPPPAAIDACADLEASSECSFVNRRGIEVEGLCTTPPRGDQLACRPNDRPGRGKGRRR
jgi:hypothetical protein